MHCHLIKIFHSQRLVSGDSRQGLDSPAGCDDEEELLLKQAIALSLEGAEENDIEEEDNTEQDAQGQEDGEEEEENLMLKQAIALSLLLSLLLHYLLPPLF